MTTDNQENKGNAAPLPLSERGATRRRLAKAGIGAAGILWTLESRATMNTMICKAPSGALSGGLSSHYSPATACSGLSPGYWKNHRSWPVSRNIMFTSVFDVQGEKSTCTEQTINQSYLCSTMLNLLSKQSFDRYNLGMHLVATYLNIMSGKISFLSVDTLQKMWTDVQATGHYSPASGVFWSAEQVKNYLQATHD
ncbi:hypothetical protein ACI48D_07110 [Massilia sp. LXY-6]|uniref:hypothetical protein n=1 Tax=Massilia sp. LXY-6 TaxID=3379823 RepID=UPI003EDF106E